MTFDLSTIINYNLNKRIDMNIELLTLGGYGQFVWPAFIFTFVSCFALYLKTRKEFQKQEKMFVKEFKQMATEKIATVKKKEALSGSPIF